MTPIDELRHLDRGPRDGEVPGGAFPIEMRVVTRDDAAGVLARCRDVLRTVVAAAEELTGDGNAGGWPDEAEWRERLPRWFVDGCRPEQTPEETARWLAWWRGLEPAAQAAAEAERGWTLADWLHWLQPAERSWYWWDGTVEGPHMFRIVLVTPDWPAPVGALEWLLRVAGAEAVDRD